MTASNVHRRGAARVLLSTLVAGLALSGCGGGDDDTAAAPAPATPARISVNGLAAVGAPLAGAAVSLRCADGSSGSTTADAQGRWTLSVPAAAFPCLGRAALASTVLHAALAAAADATTARMNITPLTDLLLTQLAGQTAVGFYDAPRYAAVTAAAADTALAQLRSQLPAALAATLGSDNPVTVAFSADGSGHDALLDALQAAFTRAGTTLAEVGAALAQGGTAAGLLPSHLLAAQLSASVGQPLTLDIAGRPLSGATAMVDFGTAASASGSVAAGGRQVTVTVPAALAGVPTVALQVQGVHGGVAVALTTPAVDTGTGGNTGGNTGGTPPTDGGVQATSGTLQVSGNPAGPFGALPASFTPASVQPLYLGLQGVAWHTSSVARDDWNLSINGLVITSVHAPTGGAFQSSALLGAGALRTAGVSVDLVGGSVRFTNVTLNRSASTTGSLVLNGTLAIPVQTGTALAFNGDGRTWIGSGMDAAAAAGVDTPIGSAVKTTHTWTSTLGTQVVLSITRIGGAVNNTQLQVTSALGSGWLRTANGATLPAGLTLDAAAKTVRFDRVSLPDNGLGGGLLLSGALAIQ